MQSKFLVVLALAVFGCAPLVMSFKQAEQHHGVPATPGNALQPFGGTHISQLGEGVEVDLDLSLLACVTLADGLLVRPLAANAIFEVGNSQTVGGSRVHKLYLANSNDPVDLSVRGLDIAVHDPDPNATEKIRNYTVRMSPIAGKNWSQVSSMNEDIVIVAQPQ